MEKSDALKKTLIWQHIPAELHPLGISEFKTGKKIRKSFKPNEMKVNFDRKEATENQEKKEVDESDKEDDDIDGGLLSDESDDIGHFDNGEAYEETDDIDGRY